MLYLSQFATTTIAGQSLTNLNVIAAVVIGGTSIFGGEGSMFGTVVGLFIPAVLQSGFVIIGVQPFWQGVAVGVVLVAAVYIDQTRRAAALRGAQIHPGALGTKPSVHKVKGNAMKRSTRSRRAAGAALTLALAGCSSSKPSDASPAQHHPRPHPAAGASATSAARVLGGLVLGRRHRRRRRPRRQFDPRRRRAPTKAEGLQDLLHPGRRR